MKTINKMGFQGDVCFIRLDASDEERVRMLPAPAKTTDGSPIVVAHSETGHHHAIFDSGVVLLREPSDPLTCYLRVDGAWADVVHERPFDTHETIRLPQGTWTVRRQREYTPEGWRMVQD